MVKVCLVKNMTSHPFHCVYTFRPTSVQNLAAMEEVAEEKACKYGDAFTRLVREFCAGKDWKTDVMPGDVAITAKVRREVTRTARLM